MEMDNKPIASFFFSLSLSTKSSHSSGPKRNRHHVFNGWSLSVYTQRRIYTSCQYFVYISNTVDFSFANAYNLELKYFELNSVYIKNVYSEIS